MHKLLARQIRKEPDHDRLLALISQTYEDQDQARERQDRANRLMAEEVQSLTARIREEAEARVNALFDAMPDGAVVLGPDGRISSANPAAQNILGRTAAQLLGRPIEELLPSAGLAFDLQPGFREMEWRSGDGMGVIPVDLTVSQIPMADRRVPLLIFRDVTERKATIRSLQEAMRSAESAARAKAQFLATMSHEIRTPMNGVLGMVAMLLDEHLTDTQRQYLEVVRESGEALLTIINDVLDYSKVDAGGIAIAHEDFSPRAVLAGVIALLEPKAAVRSLQLQARIAGDVPQKARGDAARIRQILLNLVGNAVKFTNEGSVTVQLSAEGCDGEGGCYLRFAVTDTGIGVREEDLGRLFAEFVQVDSSATRRFAGTGLGLAICRRLAALMGGTVEVQSTLGVGSTFALRLPVAKAQAVAPVPSAPPRASMAVARTRALYVLVVDDNPVNRLVAVAMLRAAGHRCEVASDGALAVQAVQSARFDLVLMDVHMPEMDGLTATRTIRALSGDVARVPIIGLTASAMAEDKASCLAAGMDGYVSKPIDRKQLFAAAEEVTRGA